MKSAHWTLSNNRPRPGRAGLGLWPFPHWRLAILLVISASMMALPSTARGQDYLNCVRVLDRSRYDQAPPLDLLSEFGQENCSVKKGAFLCAPSVKQGEDLSQVSEGVRLCYRAKCTGGSMRDSMLLPDEFARAGRVLKTRRSRMICTAAGPMLCGNGQLDGEEECDPLGDDSACPGDCRSDCTCPEVAACNGMPATIVGTSGDDVLEGTDGDDVIQALDGNDVVFGRGGNDIICGVAATMFSMLGQAMT
jgi:hypothetical protein